MKKLNVIVAMGFSLLISGYSIANDCTLAINEQEAIKCLERKIKSLKQQLHEKEKSGLIPSGAIITFQSKSCPIGWQPTQTKNNIVTISPGQNTISCIKN
ncbi:hypothetical protein LP316_10285 [Thalassotalea sp. LPB0316]|uniref:hypothetical protein n=1 Tax=Thalassotalea sp. LPB0316 TaxID=2769490 RepID=UPI001865BB76|nr:hypothetical protein [Thalassotalea sp. LPB0316]QOL24718.1 hypothetical protein LP316_10285 [Thalassotalea sp. LPB0316]